MTSRNVGVLLFLIVTSDRVAMIFQLSPNRPFIVNRISIPVAASCHHFRRHLNGAVAPEQPETRTGRCRSIGTQTGFLYRFVTRMAGGWRRLNEPLSGSSSSRGPTQHPITAAALPAVGEIDRERLMPRSNSLRVLPAVSAGNRWAEPVRHISCTGSPAIS